jgi:two-component system sensor histidine kinase KdpD
MKGLSKFAKDPLPSEVLGQYSIAGVAVFLLAFGCYALQSYTGPHFAPLLFLLAIVIVGLRWTRGPVIFMAVLSALVLNFLFIQPRFTLHISDPQDAVLFGVFLAVALSMGHLTARLREREAAARSHSREKENLLDSVSHELKTPIAVIRTAIDGLGTGNPFAAEIDTACRRLERLVGHLLEITRVESHAVQPQPDWCELGEIMEAVGADLHRELVSHPLRITGVNSLPLLKLDARLLGQVISNIIHNATNFGPEGRPIEVTASVTPGEVPKLALTVRDHGPGLPIGGENQVFGKFFRGPGAPPGGSGLGLAIAAGLMKALGGTLDAANHRDGGASFTLTLPVETRDPSVPNS